MSEEKTQNPTLALSTKVEEDFVAPLTAVRGSLEILRDFPDLDGKERLRFLESALRACTRLEQSVKELGTAVYSAGRQAETHASHGFSAENYKTYAERIKLLDDIDTIEIDFSNFEFANSDIVNQFHDVVEELVEASGHKWYFLVNYRNCSIWPEAWVAFAHRGKRINVNFSLGTARFAQTEPSEDDAGDAAQSRGFDPDMYPSRQAALAALEDIKRRHHAGAAAAHS